MEHRQVVLSCVLLLLLREVESMFPDLLAEDEIPLGPKGILGHKLAGLIDAHPDRKHGTIPIPELVIDLPHTPIETLLLVVLVKAREILGQHLKKLFADGLQLLEIVIAEELERRVHYAAVVQGSHCQSRRRGDACVTRRRTTHCMLYLYHRLLL